MTPNEVMVDVGVDVIGRFIKVTRRERNKWIKICEIYVYGGNVAHSYAMYYCM